MILMIIISELKHCLELDKLGFTCMGLNSLFDPTKSFKLIFLAYHLAKNDPEKVITAFDSLVFCLIYLWDILILTLQIFVQIYSMMCSIKVSLNWIMSINPYEPPLLYFTDFCELYLRTWTWIPGILGIDFSFFFALQSLDWICRFLGSLYIPLPQI